MIQSIQAACDYCGHPGSDHLADCPQRLHEFSGNPSDPNDFCGECNHLYRDANHVQASVLAEEPDDDLAPGEQTMTVDGTEARVITELPLSYAPQNVGKAIERLEAARQAHADAVEAVREASAVKKEKQEHLNAAVDAVVEAQRATRQPGLFA